MKVLLGYRDIMELGVSKKAAYKMLNLICESEAYKKSNLSKVIDTKKVPTKLFIRMFPEFKEGVNNMMDVDDLRELDDNRYIDENEEEEQDEYSYEDYCYDFCKAERDEEAWF